MNQDMERKSGKLAVFAVGGGKWVKNGEWWPIQVIC